MMRWQEGTHSEPTIRLGVTEESAYVWNFPDPLPVPLPPEMAVEVIAAELIGIRDDLLYAARSVGCRLDRIEKTLRDVTGGRAG
jgi:hypothetical protein